MFVSKFIENHLESPLIPFESSCYRTDVILPSVLTLASKANTNKYIISTKYLLLVFLIRLSFIQNMHTKYQN